MSEFNDIIQPESAAPVNKKRSAKKVILIVVLVIFAIAAVAGVGFAKKIGGLHNGPGKLGFMMEMLTKDLDLNAQQKTDIDKIKDEIKTKMEANKDKRKGQAEDFENLLRQSSLDKNQVLEMQSKHETDREDMKNFMAEEMVKFHGVLTQEQRNKAADKMKEFREKRMNDKDKHGWKNHPKTN
jgi:Spy/CpxP family protein refolding chaperone